jgi:hypothetical protein
VRDGVAERFDLAAERRHAADRAECVRLRGEHADRVRRVARDVADRAEFHGEAAVVVDAAIRFGGETGQALDGIASASKIARQLSNFGRPRSDLGGPLADGLAGRLVLAAHRFEIAAGGDGEVRRDDSNSRTCWCCDEKLTLPIAVATPARSPMTGGRCCRWPM